MKEQSERLGRDPIPGLLADMAIPAAIGMFVMAFHNIIDTFFIARFIGTIGVGALSIALPVQMIVLAVGGAMGVGGGSIISRRLGAGRVEEANKVYSNVLGIVILFSIVGVVLGVSLLTPLLYLFGSSEGLLPYARDYLSVILYGTPFFIFGMAANNIIRSEGSSRIAMVTMVISSILNIILTPMFIFIFGMGVKGAAIATVIAQGISNIYQALYFTKEKSSLTLRAAHIFPRWDIFKQIASIGTSFFVFQAAGSIMIIVANHSLSHYSGDLAIAVFGIIYKIITFMITPLIGINQGLLPLVGYNYGAKQHERVSESIQLAIKVAIGVSCLVFVLIMVFPKAILMIFTDETAALEMGVPAMRIMFACCIVIGVHLISGGVFQALGKAREAFIISMSRQIFFLIPLLLLLPLAFGLKGIWIAFPVSDILAFLLVLSYINKNRSIFFHP